MDCSGEHRSFGVQVSYIKSLTLDQWNETQFNTMRVGGNKRLRDFLLSNDMPEYLDKKEIYSSKLMSYYRRMLKVEAKGEMFMEQMPPREHFWDPAETGSENENESYSGGGLFNKNNSYSGSGGYKGPSLNEDYNFRNDEGFSNRNNRNNSGGYNNSNNLNDLNDIFNFNENSIPDYSKTASRNNFEAFDNSFPKSEIIISDNHYQSSNNNISSNFKNTTPTPPKFKTFESSYKNDSRFASIGSEPMDSYSDNSSGGYLSTVGSVLGSLWTNSVNAATYVKDKMTEYEVGSKIMYVGGKAIQAVAYAGGKAIEKGAEIAQSETMHNIVSAAGEGIGNLKDKITGKKSSGGGGYGEYGNSDRYSSRGSDDY